MTRSSKFFKIFAHCLPEFLFNFATKTFFSAKANSYNLCQLYSVHCKIDVTSWKQRVIIISVKRMISNFFYVYFLKMGFSKNCMSTVNLPEQNLFAWHCPWCFHFKLHLIGIETYIMGYIYSIKHSSDYLERN